MSGCRALRLAVATVGLPHKEVEVSARETPVVTQAVWAALHGVASSSNDTSIDTAGAEARLGYSARLSEDLGLSSLQVLAAAEEIGETLSANPVPITDVRTVGDLCDLFAAGDGPARAEPSAIDDQLMKSLDRAGKRKRKRDRGA